jgi:hypothetical protein
MHPYENMFNRTSQDELVCVCVCVCAFVRVYTRNCNYEREGITFHIYNVRK